MTAQLAFDLPITETFGANDFFPAPSNAAALAALPNARLLLIGPPGSGKTHLSHVWAGHHGAERLHPAQLPNHLPHLQPAAALAVDDAHLADPAALFHLYNLLAPQGRLLLTAPLPPRDWAQLPDLLSRLQTLPTAPLQAPDDALLSAVLVKLFADRQITVPPNLIPYLILRMERSIAAARALVATLDAHALAAGRPISRALAGEVLGSHTPPD